MFALPLDVSLLAGTDVETQLSGKTVGDEVRKALEKTVRNLGDEVRATQEGDAWTVVDGHRRWKLTAQPEALKTGARLLDTADLDLPALIAALDQKQVDSGAKAVFERLFAGNHRQPPDLANYVFTITPLPTEKSWRVEYQFEAQLITDHVSQVVLKTSGGVVWWDQTYDRATILAIEDDLSSGSVHELVQGLLASRFYKAPAFIVTPVDTDTWTIIASVKRELTLHIAPAALTITALTYQSGDPNADAVAWPENHNPAAYVQLKKANFPWSLPVDLPLEEVRLFLERARTSRLRLIELMLPVDQPLQIDATVAGEVLGLSEAEAKLIAKPLPSIDPDSYARAVYANWGISSDIYVPVVYENGRKSEVKVAPLDYLKNVSILLQRSQLSFEELQAVLSTRFVSGGTAPLRIQPQLTCKPSEMTLLELTAAHLDRIHRFVRLWRKLDWTMHELDLAIHAFGGQLQPDTLTSLARLQRLKQQLELPVTSLVAAVHLLETQSWTDYLHRRRACAAFVLRHNFSTRGRALGE